MLPAPYVLMTVLALLVIALLFVLQRWPKPAVVLGHISWLALSLYFLVEYLVIQATTLPYDPLHQPMSDLGVTGCGESLYALSDHAICSPLHLTMNWTFTIAGLATIAGALSLRLWLPPGRKTRAATILWIIHGLSSIAAGIVPADIDFWLHTLGSIPSMVVQIPALILIALLVRGSRPALSVWTWTAAVVTTASLVLLFVQPGPLSIPGGLLQRILYGSVYVWMSVTAIAAWRGSRR